MTEHVPDLDRFRDDLHRAMYQSSGKVQEARRFPQFLYWLMRDGVPVGDVGQAMLRTFFPPAGDLTMLQIRAGFAEFPMLYVGPNRLVDAPNDRHFAFIRHLSAICSGADDLGRMPRVIRMALENTPDHDKTIAFISNGWLMRYCQFVADALQNGLPSETQTD